MDGALISDPTINIFISDVVSLAINGARDILRASATSSALTEVLEFSFGKNYDQEAASSIFGKISIGDFGSFPPIEVLSGGVMPGANAAYSTDTDTIYLNSDFVFENAGNVDPITNALLEEFGHSVDAKINVSDSPGDEGERYSGSVQGRVFSEEELNFINSEDDSFLITIDGKEILVELSSPLPSPKDFGIDLKSASYTSKGGNKFMFGVLDQCTEFAFGRGLEKGLINKNSGIGSKISGNAGKWDDNVGDKAWGKSAKANSFVVWDAKTGGAGEVGHVGFVEKINPNGSFVISEFNWNYGNKKFNSRTVNIGTKAFNAAKFIYL